MSGERIFLLVFGIVLAATRSLGVVAPEFFARLAKRIWRSGSLKALSKVWAVVAMGLGGLGLYLAWGPATVQAAVAAALGVFLVAGGVGLLTGWMERFADRLIEAVQDAFVCRVMASMAVVIGLLIICVAIA